MLSMALSAVGFSTLVSARLYLMEQALCRTYYLKSDPAMLRPDGSVSEMECKLNPIQADLAILAGTFEFMACVPGESYPSDTIVLPWPLTVEMAGLIATPAYTRLASTWGKRTILIINACSSTLGTVYFTAVCKGCL
jgi:hypothetical protein